MIKVFLFLILMVESTTFANQKCVNLISNEQVNLSRQPEVYPAKVPKIISHITRSPHFDKSKVLFILLPGNTLSSYHSTNHNVGYNAYDPIRKYFDLVGSASEMKAKSNGVPLESRSPFIEEATLAIYDWDRVTYETQKVHTQQSLFRTEKGEVFYGQDPKTKAHIFLLRNIGNYNDSADFFVSLVDAVGGTPSQVVVVRDELNIPLGEIRLRRNEVTPPNGNNALESLQRNFLATQILESLENYFKNTESFRWLTTEQQIDFFRNLRIQLVNTDSKLKIARSSTASFIASQLTAYVFKLADVNEKAARLALGEDLIAVNKMRGKVMQEKDPSIKKALEIEFNEKEAALKNKYPIEFKNYEFFGKFKKDHKVLISEFQRQFDLQIKSWPENHTFSEVLLGTGYNQWFDKHSKDGFKLAPLDPELSSSDMGGKAHFVLSQFDQGTFNVEFYMQAASVINFVIQNNIPSNNPSIHWPAQQ